MSWLVKNARRSPTGGAHAVTAVAGGGVRSEAPMASCRAGHRARRGPCRAGRSRPVAPGRRAGPSHRRARLMNGTPGSPGPPASTTKTGPVARPADRDAQASVLQCAPRRRAGRAAWSTSRRRDPRARAAAGPAPPAAGPAGAAVTLAAAAARSRRCRLGAGAAAGGGVRGGRGRGAASPRYGRSGGSPRSRSAAPLRNTPGRRRNAGHRAAGEQVRLRAGLCVPRASGRS